MKFEKWSAEHRDLARRIQACRNMPQEDFDVFWAKACQAELDPLLDQALPVGRMMKTDEPVIDSKTGSQKMEQGSGGKWWPVWVKKTVYSFQATAAGMDSRAQRFPDCIGIQSSSVHKKDECVIDQGQGVVRHVFSPVGDRGALVGAWGRVERKGKLPVVVWLDLSEVAQGGDFWAKMPGTMAAKCARVAAIRRAYPEAFSGVYIQEEMAVEEADSSRPGPFGPVLTSPVMQQDARRTIEPVEATEPEHVPLATEIMEKMKALGPGDEAGLREMGALAATLPRGTPERRQVVAALKETKARILPPKAAVPENSEAEKLEADAIAADSMGLEPGDSAGLATLEARAAKLPAGSGAALQAQAALEKARTFIKLSSKAGA